jgi:hypothetical protein
MSNYTYKASIVGGFVEAIEEAVDDLDNYEAALDTLSMEVRETRNLLSKVLQLIDSERLTDEDEDEDEDEGEDTGPRYTTTPPKSEDPRQVETRAKVNALREAMHKCAEEREASPEKAALVAAQDAYFNSPASLRMQELDKELRSMMAGPNVIAY